MPPEWMWPFSESLEEWFEEVDRKRKEKFGGGNDDTSSDDGSMMRNELAEGRR